MNTEGIGVLVAVDGSACGTEALEWAAADVAARHGRLTVATVSDLPRLADVPLSSDLLASARQAAQRTVDSAVRRAEQLAPGIAVQGRVGSGNPAAELIMMAAGAEQVVVGSRGTGGIAALLIGSVGGQVAEHVGCPAVVVRDRRQGGPVVVGTDDSEHSQAALEYGFGYADRHGLPLVAMHVCAVDGYGYRTLPDVAPSYPAAEELDLIRADAARRAEQGLGRWASKYPAVETRVEVVDGRAADRLVEASRDAALLVVGTRGHGGLAGMLLGSVSHAVMRHAHCPVVIAR
jgi:nucleotide-binding universal stress UspA family protein